MLRIPEGDGIKESLGIAVGVLKLPMLATVGSVIDARLFARSGRHEERFVCGERSYSAEVECGGIRDLVSGPAAPAIYRTKIAAVCAAGPGNLAGNGAYSAQVLSSMRDLNARSGLCHCTAGDDYNKQRTH